jgi:hypothetical protein
MSLMEALVFWASLFGILGFLLYFRETRMRRDFQTDMFQLMHDYDADRDDLRRTLKYPSVELHLQRCDDEDGDST